MKAMLFADWMSIRRSMKALLWVFAVMAVAAFAYGGSAFIPFMVTMLSVMGPATLMSTDHAYGWAAGVAARYREQQVYGQPCA